MKRNLTLVYGLVLSILFIVCSIRNASGVNEPPIVGGENAFDSPDEARQYFLDKRVPLGETTLPTERYIVADQQMQEMPTYSTATNTFSAAATQGYLGTWDELGPGNIGGRTRALLIDPTNTNTMYAGGIAGGLWKTIDGGQNWTPKSQTLMPIIAINCLARGSDSALYAGTGDLQAPSFDLYIRGLGIYKSTDAGETWSVINGTETQDFFNVNDVVVSPSDPRVLYAATDSGVWQGVKKLNKEKYTWTNVLPTSKAYDLAIRTDTPDYILAAFPGKIYRTTNSSASGGTWSQVYSDTGAGRISLAIAPSNQDCVYGLSAGNSNELRAVIKSTNRGSNWLTTVSGPFNPGNINTWLLTSSKSTLCDNSPYSQGGYDNVIAVDPNDPNKVWAGGIDLFRSDDGGNNWKFAAYWWTSGSHYVHADYHAIVFHPAYNGSSNTTMFVGCDGGIFKTDAARGVTTGCTFNALQPCDCFGDPGLISWASLNHGYGVTQFYHGLPYPDGATYFGGAQDNGTLVGSQASGMNWSMPLSGDGGFVAITPQADTRYAETQGGKIYKANNGGSFFYTFEHAHGIGEVLPFITTFVMDPNNSQRLWLGGTTAMWRTDDGAGSWSRAHSTSQLGDGSAITAIAVAPGNVLDNIAIAGTREGNIYRTSNANMPASSVSWTPAVPPRTDSSRVAWLSYDPSDSNHTTAYAAYSNFNTSTTAGRKGHVFKSTNGGASFTNIDGSIAGAMIPDVPTHCIVVDPTNSLRLYAGTDVGVFVTVDGGTRWSRENTGFANAPTEALAVGLVNNVYTLYAFTGGRGAWRVSLGTSACSPPVPPSILTATAVSAAEIDLQWQYTATNASGFTIERGLNQTTFSVVATVSSSQHTYNDMGLASNTPYFYRVKTLSTNCGESGYSIIASATTFPGGSPPAPPSMLTATAFSISRIDLTWHDNSNNEGNFHIDRKLGASGTYSDIATVAADSTSYSDTMNIQPNTTYFYRVRACNMTFGCSANSPEASATTPPGPPPPACVTVSLLSGHGTPGYIEGIGAGAQWSSPRGGVVAKHPLTGDQTLFVADTDNHRIRLVYLEGSKNGRSEWIAGDGVAGYRGGTKPADRVHYNAPMGIGASVDSNGRVIALFIADTFNHMIRKLIAPASAGLMWTPQDFLGEPTVPGSDSTHFNFPQGVTVGADGNIYVADSDNALIRKISASGVMSTIINGGAGLVGPVGIAVSQSSLLYISDPGSNSIWRATTSGTSLTRIAGSTTGASGSLDGTGNAARFNKPYHLVWCNPASGERLYVADRQNHRLRQLAIASTIVTTPAGSTQGYHEGNCMTALFSSPRGVAAVSDGNVYLLDTGNQRIRKVQ